MAAGSVLARVSFPKSSLRVKGDREYSHGILVCMCQLEREVAQRGEGLEVPSEALFPPSYVAEHVRGRGSRAVIRLGPAGVAAGRRVGVWVVQVDWIFSASEPHVNCR